MKRISILYSLLVIMFGFYSCEEPDFQPGFEDMEQMTIFDFIEENDSLYSDFMEIMKAGKIDRAMSAYNPNSTGYTLFLPTNEAISKFITANDNYSSLEAMLEDEEYSAVFSRYHIVDLGINANDFPFGALPAMTLSEDFLTVSFVIETDTSYYKINNQAPVIKTNVELSNGFVHVINNALTPITYTTYAWISDREEYSIFKAAVDATGFEELLSRDLKSDTTNIRPVTLLLEPDSVYNRKGIYTLEDLIAIVNPDDQNYTDPGNKLYNYVGYHILAESNFLDDFVGRSTNYSTYSDVPININGLGLDIAINKTKMVFDTIVEAGDTTIIDFVGFYYDESNVLTNSGAIHFIDQVMLQQPPSRATQTYEFYGETLLDYYRANPGTYTIEDTSLLTNITWRGAELNFTEMGDEAEINAWGNDYLFLEGDFEISYTIPKIIPGSYEVVLGAEGLSQGNAVVEVYVDGKNIGGLIDLATGGSTDYPFHGYNLGTIDFVQYEQHVVEVRSLIPGMFMWDYIRFQLPD